MMTDVTQSDRDAAAWALDLAPNSQTWETLTAAHRTLDQIWQANRVAQAFAAHRLATEARAMVLVEALTRIAGNNWKDQSRARYVARQALKQWEESK